MLALVAVVVVSAVQRMRMYETAYGMTELRLYTTAFMAWVTFVLVWFAATVLPGKRGSFAFGAGLAGVILYLALNAVNPAAVIVRPNAGRARNGHSFDAAYATSLGADAVPELLDALADLPKEARCPVANALVDRWSADRGDWRTWDISESQAVHAVRAHFAELRTLQCRGERLTLEPCSA